MKLVILLAILVVLNCLDIYSTKKAIDSGAYEANPIAAKFIDKFGTVKGLVVLKGGMLAVVIGLVSAAPITAFGMGAIAVADVIYAGIVLHNFKLVKDNGPTA